MKLSRNSLALAAAFAGLVGGATARASQPTQDSSSAAGLHFDDATQKIDKHACKGKNQCKGNGGGSEKEWGRNECKGRGACATDGSKKKKK